MALKPIQEVNQEKQIAQLRLDQPEPPPENILALLELGTQVEIEIGGRRFIAPPTPFKIGFRLDQLYHEIAEFRNYSRPWALSKPYEDRVTEIKSIIWNLLIPISRLDRILKAFRLRGGPPSNWSDADIGRLLGFFRLYRMKSNIRFSYQTGLGRVEV
jgi:hypothetical protein